MFESILRNLENFRKIVEKLTNKKFEEIVEHSRYLTNKLAELEDAKLNKLYDFS